MPSVADLRCASSGVDAANGVKWQRTAQRPPSDNARAIVVEALLAGLRHSSDEEIQVVADALQDSWWKLKIGIELHGWEQSQPWTFAWRLFSVQFNGLS